MNAWESEIKDSDVPKELRPLAKRIGLGNLLEVLRYYEGGNIYFPKIDGAFKNVRDRVIRREWAKTRNPLEIGKRHNLTARQVRLIVGDHEDQAALFPA